MRRRTCQRCKAVNSKKLLPVPFLKPVAFAMLLVAVHFLAMGPVARRTSPKGPYSCFMEWVPSQGLTGVSGLALPLCATTECKAFRFIWSRRLSGSSTLLGRNASQWTETNLPDWHGQVFCAQGTIDEPKHRWS